MMQAFAPTAGLTPVMAWRQLSERQRRFLVNYTVEPNAAKAARQAGYSAKGAKVQGHRLLAMPLVRLAMRCDPVEMSRLFIQSVTPRIIDDLMADATAPGARMVDSARALRLLMEVGGMVERRRRRR